MQDTIDQQFFTNAAGREHGFTDQFWRDAYAEYDAAVQRALDNDGSFDEWFVERTVRVSFEGREYDVLARTPPVDPGECLPLRFSAFPAGPDPEPRQLSRGYMHDDEDLRPLGEAVLLDLNYPW